MVRSRECGRKPTCTEACAAYLHGASEYIGPAPQSMHVSVKAKRSFCWQAIGMVLPGAQHLQGQCRSSWAEALCLCQPSTCRGRVHMIV